MTTHQASIWYMKRDGRKTFRWECEHAHRTEEGAFACGSREVRRRFAPSRPRSDIETFTLSVRSVAP